jgi:hypothetical protein
MMLLAQLALPANMGLAPSLCTGSKGVAWICRTGDQQTSAFARGAPSRCRTELELNQLVRKPQISVLSSRRGGSNHEAIPFLVIYYMSGAPVSPARISSRPLVRGGYRFRRRHSISSTASRLRSVVGIVLDLARTRLPAFKLHRGVPALGPLEEPLQLMSKPVDRQSKQHRRYCLPVPYRFRCFALAAWISD